MPSWKLTHKRSYTNRIPDDPLSYINDVKSQVDTLSSNIGSIEASFMSKNDISTIYQSASPLCSTLFSYYPAYQGVPEGTFSGSGCFITLDNADFDKGLFLTCAHNCVRNTTSPHQEAQDIYIENPITRTWMKFGPSSWFLDRLGDIAIIRTNIDFTNSSYKPLKLANESAKSGSYCVLIGDPGNYDTDSVSYGVVRSGNYIMKPVTYQTNECLFVDAASIGGNSGCPIIGLDGMIIGMLTFGFSNYENLGGGPNLNSLKNSLSVLTQFRHNKEKKYIGLTTGIQYPWSMFTLKSKNPSLETTALGIRVYSVSAESPFFSKINVGDVIISAKAYTSSNILLKDITFGMNDDTSTLGVLLYMYDCAYIVLSFIRNSDGSFVENTRVELNKTFNNVPSSKDIYLSGGLNQRIVNNPIKIEAITNV